MKVVNELDAVALNRTRSASMVKLKSVTAPDHALQDVANDNGPALVIVDAASM